MNSRYLFSLLAVIVSVLGSLYLLIEAILQSLGTSICATEGCKVVAQYTRFGDLSMVLLGLSMLSVLAVLTFQTLRAVNQKRDWAINLLLIVALGSEGYLVGYQLFWLRVVCVICLSVSGIFIALGILRVLAGHREVISGFFALAAVLSLSYLILPPTGGTALPLEQKHILFYSPDCKHCAEIRKELDDQKIEVRHVLVHEYASTLKSLGIEHVPTLLVNGPYEKIFFTGTDAIRRYLSTCHPQKAVMQAPTSKTTGPSGPSVGKSTTPLQLFSIPGTTGQLFAPSPDEGLCKEDAKCE